MPRVSVVVIAYNDAGHLPAALRSVQRQSMHDLEIVVVDDASNDATPQVIAAAAATDVRLRPMRLPENSGGCSRPRNTGLAAVTGDYVLFLDSDDVLPRRAVERLYAAAQRAQADVACGRMVRRHHDPRRHLASNDDLYARAAVLDGVLSRPAQLRDTPACGKLFRRGFLEAEGLRFPEGVLFEDLLFTTTAYAAAARIAIVPHLTYEWNVRRDQAVPSITNRRELRNWQDRFEVHRRIDADLARRPRARELQLAKDNKFLTVDWPIWLRDLRAFPPEQRPQLLDLAAGYLSTMAPERRSDVAPGLRVAAHLAASRDLDGTLAAADYVTTGGIAGDLLLDSGALDATSTGLLAAGFAATPFLAVVETAHNTGPTLELSGRVHDVLGRLASAGPEATLRVTGRFGGRLLDVPVSLAPGDSGLRFHARLDLRALGRRMHPGVGHELRLDLLLGPAFPRSSDSIAHRPLTARDAALPAQALTLPNRWQRLLGIEAHVRERNGRLVLALDALHPGADAVLDLASRCRLLVRHRLPDGARPQD
jgi:CDP-glycerol glycerophosphotransferase